MSESPQTLEIGGHKIAPGGRIGPYLYVKRVGKGGMADVLLCRDPNDEPVALKVLKGSRLTKGSALQRFRRQVNHFVVSAAQLERKNRLQIFTL